jgi:uncharacterized membrane protein
VSILGRGTSVDNPRVLSLRMRAMLLTSLLVIAFALFPLLLAGYGIPVHVVWIGTSAVLLVATLGYYSWLRDAIRTLGRAGLTPSPFQRRVIIPTLLLTLVAVASLLVLNAALAIPAVYLTALTLLLSQSAFAFCLIVFSFLPRIHADDASPGRDVEEG